VKKNWLARLEANAVVRGTRTAGAVAGRWFRSRPLVQDAAFQQAHEPYPGHWSRSPAPEPPIKPAAGSERVLAALEELPDTWRRVLLHHDVPGAARAERQDVDSTVAAALGLTVAQERDILARARASVRDTVTGTPEADPR